MAKLTKKSYRRKRMLMGLALFMSVALISTGFAAWVISSSVEKESNSNVQVGTISDKSIGLTVELLDVDGAKTTRHQTSVTSISQSMECETGEC